MSGAGESEQPWRAYRIGGHNLTPDGRRVLVTAHDEAGDVLCWTAEPDRAPRLGLVVNVTMNAQTDPPSDDASGGTPCGGAPMSDRRLDALAEAGYRLVEVPAAWPHRVVGGNEANQLDLIHGCCAVCLVPWPCPSQFALDEAALSSVGADLAAWCDSMANLGWCVPTDRAARFVPGADSGGTGRAS